MYVVVLETYHMFSPALNGVIVFRSFPQYQIFLSQNVFLDKNGVKRREF